MPKRAQRRLDHFSKMVLLAAHQAIEDAELSPHDVQDMGIVVASGYGAMRTTLSRRK
jgi:3-oxoacyl-[acyl-carrier-protein] synthase II